MTFTPRSDMGNPQTIKPSSKFYPPKICLTCSKPYQGSSCPHCDLVPEDA